MQKILPGLHSLTGLPVGRVYLVEDPDGLTLIDLSVASAADSILRQIRALGRAPQDVKRILITHAHPDHVGDLPRLKRETGAQVIASAIEQPVIEGRMAVPRPPRESLRGLSALLQLPEVVYPPTPVDLPLQGGETLPVLGGLQAVLTPGHAPGHLSFWQPQLGVLFCGDVLFNLPNLRLPFAVVTVDMEADKRSVRQVAALEPRVVCFGHGRPLAVEAAAALRRFVERMDAA